MAPLQTIPEDEEVAFVTESGTQMDYDGGKEKNIDINIDIDIDIDIETESRQGEDDENRRTIEEGRTSTINENGGEKRNKKSGQGFNFIAATQNFRGMKTEGEREEVRVQMKRQGLHLICGQESWCRNDASQERWETGELFVNCGGNENSKKHDGVCFFLSKKMAKLFEKSGREVKKYCSRLATMRITISPRMKLYIVNVHFPDSGQRQEMRNNYNVRFEKALQAARSDETVLVMGDFNAEMGVAQDDDDEVCGKHGNAHTNTAGRNLKTTMGLYGLTDLVSHFPQSMEGTWVHPRSKKWHQLDRVFIARQNKHMVRKCMNGEMLTDSDHMSVRLNLDLKKLQRVKKTARQEMSRKDTSGFSSEEGATAMRVAIEYKQHLQGGGDMHDCLMKAVAAVMEGLPMIKRKKSGWCDLNFEYLAASVERRNDACREYARTKADEAKRILQTARKELKRLKIKAKNQWMLGMLKDSNTSILPDKTDRKNPKDLWSLTKKLKNGLDKWRKWEDTNVRDEQGTLAVTPEENAENFKKFFDKLFDNDQKGLPPKEAYKGMKYKEVAFSYREPTMREMRAAIKGLKNTAPGRTGIPASVWKGLAKNEETEKAMLEIMIENWKLEKVPNDWTKFHMCVLPKKGDLTNVANWRGISMAETLSKVYSTIIKKRLEAYYDTIAPEYCNGFRGGRGRNDSIYVLKELLRKRKAKGLDSYGIYYDFIKCFDELARDNIWESMRVTGVPEKMIRVVMSTLQDSECEMHVSGVKKSVRMKEGSGQGTTLGPILCNFFFLPLLQEFEKRMEARAPWVKASEEMGGENFVAMTHNFADDTCMVVGTLEHAKYVAKEFNTFIKGFRSRVHVATATVPKSKSVVVFYPANEGEKSAEQKIEVNDDGTEWIDFTDGSPYLGSYIHTSLRDDHEIRTRIRKAAQMYGCLRRHLLSSKDTWREVKKKVLVGMILPIMLDGAEQWVISAQVLREMKTAYHKMIRGCLRMTTHTTRKHRISTSTMLGHLDMEPLEYYVDWRVLGYAGHVERMQDNRLPKKMRDASIEGKGKVGAPPKTHERQRNESMKRKGINKATWKDEAVDKNKWRAMIKGKCVTPPTSSFKDELRRDPSSAIGTKVEKLYRQKWYGGVIVDTDEDSETGDQIWGVKYDDGETADYTRREIKKMMITEEKVPSTTTRIATNKSPPPQTGRNVAKWFDGKRHKGVVEDMDIDAENGEQIWRVVYEDGDESDYNKNELQQMITPQF